MSSKASDPGAEGRNRAPPACTILAGANGSGKSSLFERLRPTGLFVNADAIAQVSGAGNIQAARLAVAQLNGLVRNRTDFVFETTLSSRHALATMRQARDAGYEVGLVFVVLADVTLNVRRVAERVGRGGHHIPEADIQRRYPRGLRNLARAVSLADACLVYDNSGLVPELLVRIKGEIVEENYLDPTRAHHARIAEAVRLRAGTG